MIKRFQISKYEISLSITDFFFFPQESSSWSLDTSAALNQWGGAYIDIWKHKSQLNLLLEEQTASRAMFPFGRSFPSEGGRELPSPPSPILPCLTASAFTPEPGVQVRGLHVQQAPQTQPLIFFHHPGFRPLSCQATFDGLRHLTQLGPRRVGCASIVKSPCLPSGGPRYFLRSDPKGFIH